MTSRANGQSLVEIVVAIGVVVLLVTGVVVATTQSLSNVQGSQTRSLAIQRAQEGMEFIRNLRNGGWSTFQGYQGTWCLDGDGVFTWAPSDACSVNVDGVFTRSILLAWDEVNERMDVTIVVSWDEGGVVRDTTIETYLTNWQ